MNRYIFIFSATAVLCFVAGASINTAHAATSTSVLRVEFVEPPGVVPETGFFSRLRIWLGVRPVTRIHPEPGTQLIVYASAYAPSAYQTDATPCKTAAGTIVRPGVVASNFLPLGTLLDINGETFIVEDRMNPRYQGYYIDIFFPHTSDALEFGRQKLTITILGYGEPGQPLVVSENEETLASEETPVATAETSELSFIDRVRSQIQTINETVAQLIGARVSPDVNRYDVDCLTAGD